MTVAVRTDYSAAALRAVAKGAVTPDQARRLLAVALVLEGASRDDAARSTGMDRQTLRDWVHRFNAAGPDGLVERKAPGRQRRLSACNSTSCAVAWKAVPISRRTAWYAGGWSIGVAWSSGVSASATRSGAWASSSRRSVSAGSRRGPGTPGPPLKRKPSSKKTARADRCRRRREGSAASGSRSGSRTRAGIGQKAGCPANGHGAAADPDSPEDQRMPVRLFLCRRLPGGRKDRCPGPAARRHRSLHPPASGRDRPSGRTPRPMPWSSSTRPAGTVPGPCWSPRTSPCCRSRPTARS